jgi:hypothetical protein
MATARAQYAPSTAQAALASIGASARAGQQETISSGVLGQALLGALVNAELMAAQAGVVPLEQGGVRVDRIGAAMATIDRAPEPVRTIYLAVHRAVYEAQSGARELGADARIPATTGGSPLASNALIIGLIVTGVVAISAWGLAHEVRMMLAVSGDALRQVAIANRAAELQLQGVPPDAPAFRILRALAERGLPDDGPLWVFGVLLVGVAGALAWAKREKLKWLVT